MDEPSVMMVCGERFTGKDFLFRQLAGKETFNWCIFAADSKRPFDMEPRKRIAFADALKEEVLAEDLDLNLHVGNFGVLKDSVVKGETGETGRDLCIARGKMRREEDPDYWCKAAFKGVGLNERIIVTDWRYPNEHAYVASLSSGEPVTVRVYCTEVPLNECESERSLDDWKTDFLLVRSEHDIDARHGIRLCDTVPQAAASFPQYEHYICIYDGQGS